MLIQSIVGSGFSAVLVGIALSILVLSSWLLFETVLALLPESEPPRSTQQPGSIAVLVPAHNEESGLSATIAQLKPQLRSHDRLVVIADNCTDNTATVAREMGAIVLERQNLTQIGKGYALDYGLQYLATEPPDLVVLVDADCAIGADAIAKLTEAVVREKRPMQAQYLMTKPPEPNAKDAVSVFAFMVKNLVRPLGLSRLGLPCLLTGTGMAFPWAAIRSVSLASGHLVEDMKLSLDLTIAGYAPAYCQEARVTGSLPQQERATRSQRTRWEHGHLQSMLMYVPLLIKAAVEQQRPEAIVLALELSVPPLSLFAMSWLGLSAIAIGWGVLSGNWLAAIVAAIAGVSLLIAVLSAWMKFGREDLPLKELVAIPLYILWKIPLYFKFLIKPQQTWVRTERDSESLSQSVAEAGD